jgi:hypothetical protein
MVNFLLAVSRYAKNIPLFPTLELRKTLSPLDYRNVKMIHSTIL